MRTLRSREFRRGRRHGAVALVATALALGAPAPARAGWQQLAGGAFHTCGIADGGSVLCWGASGAGQDEAPPGAARQLVSGAEFSCALAAGTDLISCWGAASSGQTSPPGAVYTQISAGDEFACGLLPDSTVECWGSNALGQLAAPAGRFTRVTAGANHACARRESGALECWGDDAAQQASPLTGGYLGPTAGRRHSCALDALGVAHCWGLGAGAAAPAAAGLRQLSAGGEHTCAVDADAALRCWGADGSGQATPPAGAFRSVHSGENHSCAIATDGSAQCWGRDLEGQTTPPVPRTPGLSVGSAFSCALRAVGTIDCWGLDGAGQLGVPPGSYTALAAGTAHGCALAGSGSVACWGADDEGQVSAIPPSLGFSAISAGREHSCALASADDMPRCWGSDALGQLQAPAVRLESIDAGSFHTCGIGDQGAVHCWGFDGSGQVSSPSDPMTRVSAGAAHSCGIRASDRSVVCWGLDDDGQSSPPAGPFIAVSAGRHHSCGVRLDGVARCWGLDDAGMSDPPALRFRDVSVGDAHSCGVTEDGAVACWGDASLGQLSSAFDDDADGIENAGDTCPGAGDPAQLDGDADGAGDVCDVCPGLHDPDQADSDGDGVGDLCDNCIDVANGSQLDTVGDVRGGDACRPLMLRLEPGEIETELTRYRVSVRCGALGAAQLRFGIFFPQSVAPGDVDFGDGCDDAEGCSVAQGLGDTVNPSTSTIAGPGLDEIGIRADTQYVLLTGQDNAAGDQELCSAGDFSEVFLADLLVAGVHDFGNPFLLTLQGLDRIGGVISAGGPLVLPGGIDAEPQAFMMLSGDVDPTVSIEIRPAVGDVTGTLWDVWLSSLLEISELRVGYTGEPNQPTSNLLVKGCETFSGGAANARSCAQGPGWPANVNAATSSTLGPDPGGSILPRDDTLYAELIGALPSGPSTSPALNYAFFEHSIARVQDTPPAGQNAQAPILTFDGASSAFAGADAVVEITAMPVSTDDVAFINAFTPGTDLDGDLVHNLVDNCPHILNTSQDDNGGFMSSLADGTGDRCECGESTENGAIFGDDLDSLRASLAGDPLATAPSERCSLVGDPASCDMADVVALARALGAQPGPGVGPSCAAAVAQPSAPPDP